MQGEVRVLKGRGESGRYVDLAVLQEGAINGVRCWAFVDCPGLSGIEVGDQVELDVYSTARNSKDGRAYLSTQVREVKVLSAAKS